MTRFLNLGSGTRPAIGMVNVDRFPGGADVIAASEALPFRDGAFAVVHASHVLEHLQDLSQSLREIHRVLAPGGYLVARVPYGLESLYNPFHRHAFNEISVQAFVQSESDAERGISRWRLVGMERQYNVPYEDLLFTLEAIP